MSVIELKISVNANNVEVVKEFLSRISNAEAKSVNVKDAEVVKPEAEAPKTVKKPAPKKPTPKAPEPEEVEDELESEDELDDETDDAMEDNVLSYEDVKALQAEKVVAHKEAIVKKLRSGFKVARLSDLDPKNYSEYYNFLNGLK